MERFDQTYKYKLIYIFSMPYETHKGLLKIGEATLKTDIKPEFLVPNCHDLNQAAKARIDGYTATASVKYTLLYTELARKYDGGEAFTFNDKDVHKVLMNSGIHKVQPNGETGDEWFQTTLDVAKNAIKAVKEGKSSLSSSQSQTKKVVYEPIDFREEQKDAVEKTIKTFKKSDEMLWYTKMRFGKTLTALEVVRRMQFRRVIIVTHRPVVSDGWGTDFKKIFYPGCDSEHEYTFECKTTDTSYVFNEKTDYENDKKIQKLDKEKTYFIYFASIQDLRGSQLVGGNFNKNNAVFSLDWDLIIIDEAHEGTQTELGDNVIQLLRKKNTKVLALSGTPFNLLSRYDEENVYTWDYVMEQKKKNEWDLYHHGDHNPYADLPKMHIFTYDLGEKLKKYVTDEYESKAFNFREFFRVWVQGKKRELPKHAVEGKFVHENDIKAFLDLMVKEDVNSVYPFSTQEYRDMFQHTLWMVPGVKEAKALSELLRNHPVFSHFGIANVAGEGDTYEEEHAKDALELVRKTIKENKYSITLSCGKLTTGVTVKEWTAVLMLSGSYSTAAAQYMQTIFRVQSAGSIDGRQKTDCFVFDFAPDRTLKVLTEAVQLSRKPGRSQQKRREAMKEFLNFCPVIAISGSKMTHYSVNSMMEQIKQIYAERAVNSGFDDESIYNDELLKLDDIDASKFNNLRDIIGSSKASKKNSEVVVNGQGLTDEQIENLDDPDDTNPPVPKPPLTPEEIAEQQKKKQAKEARKKAIDILRGISIRMPLMIYGADVPLDEDIDINRFVELVDDKSWEEFMPYGVTKKIFNDFTKYYDRDVFIAAGKRIRKTAAAADKETP
ncbi:MAG: DEAD/DEAH box helicase family protein, partial [Bacteroidaceae bacterium]|nr:DEAD/DEAH box helicase family protein [Bacteroidaceae bacterium]